jgi:hypothetical protein
MRTFVSTLKKAALAAIAGLALFGTTLFATAPSARAANLLELNFGLFGPSYEGKVGTCESALWKLTYQFQNKEAGYWNSALQFSGFNRVRETAFRPWTSDNIPRRYCSADALFTDGKVRQVHYSIIEDGGLAGYGDGVEWCVTGLDRNWAYNPQCRAAKF